MFIRRRRPTAATPEIKAARLKQARDDYGTRERNKNARDAYATAERQRLLMSWHGREPNPPPGRLSALYDQSREDIAGLATVRRRYERSHR